MAKIDVKHLEYYIYNGFKPRNYTDIHVADKFIKKNK